MSILERLVFKLTSGRYMLTLICGLTFAYLSYTGFMSEAAISAIVLSVFQSYFSKNGSAGAMTETEPQKEKPIIGSETKDLS